MRRETVKTDTFSMDYVCFGRGKEPLVILPGLSVESVLKFTDDIQEAYHILAEEFTVYVFDRRKDLPASYSLYDMAADTAEAMRASGLHKTFLFGASQGGMIAMTIAAHNPQLVKKMILCSTAACVPATGFRTVEAWVGKAKAGAAEDLYLAFGQALYPPEMFKQAKEFLKESAKNVTQEELRRFVILAEGIKDFDLTDELEKISCPVLLVGSRDDRVLGADATLQIAERFKNRSDFTLYLYDGYGHAVYDTAPDFKERMRRFLRTE